MFDINDFIKSIKETGPKTSPYDTSATVRRIEGKTAWVHIPGGEDETPVQLTIAAKEGDTVQVRVSGGTAFLVGNESAPPTDDTKAVEVSEELNVVQKVVKKVREVAERAFTIAGNTNQYFWHTETGTDTGAHITEIPQEEFLADPDNGGGNLLARSNGIAVRDGLVELATFGRNGQSFNNEYSASVFEVGYLPEAIDTNGRGSIDYEGESPFIWALPWDCTNVVSITYYDANGGTVSFSPSLNYTRDGRILTWDSSACERMIAANIARIDIGYYASGSFPYFTFGTASSGDKGPYSMREGAETIASGYRAHAEGLRSEASGSNGHAEGAATVASGDMSHAEGWNTTASGDISHAEGLVCEASGMAAHAQNWQTRASSNYQTAIGKCNVEDTNDEYAFIIGNGTADIARSNALTVTWDGDIETAKGAVIAQEETTTWTEPGIYSSRATVVDGGYYIEGKRVYVQCTIHLAAVLTSGSNVQCLRFPAPANNRVVLACGTNANGHYGQIAPVSGAGYFIIKASAAIATTDNIYITGEYTTA